MKVKNTSCIRLNKNNVDEKKSDNKGKDIIEKDEKLKEKMCKLDYTKEDIYTNEEREDEKEKNLKINDKTKKKDTNLIKINKKDYDYNKNTDVPSAESKNDQDINKDHTINGGNINILNVPYIDNKTIESNIKKIESSVTKLNEIEESIMKDIKECDTFIEFYDKSKTLLDSKDFNSDVGREDEIDQIRKILMRCSNKLQGEGIFLTGPSGQGKTYSIFYIINEIQIEKENKKTKNQNKNNHNNNNNNNKKNDINKNIKNNNKRNNNINNKNETQTVKVTDIYEHIDSSYFYVSCSNCERPYDIFVDILQQIMKKDKKDILSNIKEKYHLNGLEEVKKSFINYTCKLNNLKIVIVDELDFIATRNVRLELKTKTQNRNQNEDVVKALFECVQHSKSKIILIGIANSLDLIKDYNHMKINRIIYKPYNEKQFMNIIKNKLDTLEEELVHKLFKGVSLNIHVRQISNRNGDIRSCFDAILRVFSEKIIDLEERKKNLIKLKEEIMMNQIFNKQEKRNLYLLLNHDNIVKDINKKKNPTSNEQANKNNDLETCRKKRRANHLDEDFPYNENENENINDHKYHNNCNTSPSNTRKKNKINKQIKIDDSSNILLDHNYLTNDTTIDNFFIEENITPLPNLKDYTNDHGFYNKAKYLKFTDLKNESSFGYETLRKEVIKIQNNNETLSEILIRKHFHTNNNHNNNNNNNNNDDDCNSDDNRSFCTFGQYTPKQYYESPFKVLYKNDIQNEMHHFEDKEDVLNNIDIEKLLTFDVIINNQIQNIQHKYNTYSSLNNNNNNAVMITDIKKITDKIPLEEHKDILLKIKSLPLIQKLCLYASCNVVNDTHLNDYEDEEQGDLIKNKIQNIEITYNDIQKGFRNLCSNLSETNYIKDILEGNTMDQSIEHFEELGILINSKKNQKIKEKKNIKVPKGLTPRFANLKNNKNFSSQNKLNSIYYFNLPVSVIKQTLKEISSILSSLDRNANF